MFIFHIITQSFNWTNKGLLSSLLNLPSSTVIKEFQFVNESCISKTRHQLFNTRSPGVQPSCSKQCKIPSSKSSVGLDVFCNELLVKLIWRRWVIMGARHKSPELALWIIKIWALEFCKQRQKLNDLIDNPSHKNASCLINPSPTLYDVKFVSQCPFLMSTTCLIDAPMKITQRKEKEKRSKVIKNI